jgi:YVTN family beta-propeller protein
MKIGLIKVIMIGFVTIALLNTSQRCYAQATPQRALLALSKSDHTLAIVDPITLKVLARVPVGPDPHEVIASSDGKTAYVSNMGGGPNGELHELNVIDLVGQKALPNIDIKPFLGPHGLMFAAGKLWFTAQGADAVVRYDPATASIDWCMGTGQERTHMIYVTPDGKNVYTTNVTAGTVTIMQDTLLPVGGPPMGFGPAGGAPVGNKPPDGLPMGHMPPDAKPRLTWVQNVIPVSKGSEGFDVSPDGKELWTAASSDGTIAVIDIASKKVTATIDAKALGANRLKFTPNGKQVLVSSLRSGDLFVYDAATHKRLKQISLGKGAAGILVDPDGSRAFVGCTADNYVSVVDLKKMEVSGHIDVGGGPDGLAWAIRH